MNFDDLMAQARANEEAQLKRAKPRKPCNVEPTRATQKLRADLLRKQEEEKRRKEEEERRIGRQEQEKLARMEAAMREHERKIQEEQEKQDKLDRMHKEAQERREKCEAEINAKKEAARMEIERKKEEERERRREERDAKQGDLSRDEDIFRRRAQELKEKERRKEMRRKEQDDIWRRRQEQKGRDKERDKEKLRAKIREDARKVAQSLSRKSGGESERKRTSSGGLVSIEEAKHLHKLREKKEKNAKLKEELRARRAAEYESRGSSSDDETHSHVRRSSSQRSVASHNTRETSPEINSDSDKDNSIEPVRDNSIEQVRDASLEPARDASLEPARDASLEPPRDESLEPARENGSVDCKAEPELKNIEANQSNSRQNVFDVLKNSESLARSLQQFINYPDAPTKKPEAEKDLTALFGDDSDSDGSSTHVRNDTESEESVSPIKSSQDRRAKLKELARKKNSGYVSSSDDEFDYEKKEATGEGGGGGGPQSFEELLAIADRRGQENLRELEEKKQREQQSAQLKREQEKKRRQMAVELERKRKEESREKERERREEKRIAMLKKEEKAKSRIPKVSAPDQNKPSVDKETTDQGKFKVPVKRTTDALHPAKRKKTNPPKMAASGSFEELMALANQNSVNPSFGSSLKRPEDVLREQRRKEAQRKREHSRTAGSMGRQVLPSFKSRSPERKRQVGRQEKQESRSSRPDNKPHSSSSKPDNKPHSSTSKPNNKPHANSSRSEGKPHSSSSRSVSASSRTHDVKSKVSKRPMHVNPYMDDNLDDFVVDDGSDVDYSKAIRNMFGYDRRKYVDEPDDCRDMETDFRTIQKEEARSSRLAKKEDSEELKKILAEEERERRRKMKR